MITRRSALNDIFKIKNAIWPAQLKEHQRAGPTVDLHPINTSHFNTVQQDNGIGYVSSSTQFFFWWVGEGGHAMLREVCKLCRRLFCV